MEEMNKNIKPPQFAMSLAPSNLPPPPSNGLNQGGSISHGLSKEANFKPFDGTDVDSVALDHDDKNSSQPSDVDPRKLRRTISNRLSARRCRTRKLQHIYDMEKRVKILEAEIAALSPQVMFQQHQNKLLKMENYFLNQRLVTWTENNMLKNAQLEETKAEVERLRQLHMTQLQEQIQGQTANPGQ